MVVGMFDVSGVRQDGSGGNGVFIPEDPDALLDRSFTAPLFNDAFDFRTVLKPVMVGVKLRVPRQLGPSYCFTQTGKTLVIIDADYEIIVFGLENTVGRNGQA